ncbi:uncharacterized protein LOC142339711 [Convolutriloba macropyga]|uniref:uncharacterized protein LOC142339711 n=1 Tax=Convolutriloba macropyga TaxID=536237 RepID=UPI003F51C0F7
MVTSHPPRLVPLSLPSGGRGATSSLSSRRPINCFTPLIACFLLLMSGESLECQPGSSDASLCRCMKKFNSFSVCATVFKRTSNSFPFKLPNQNPSGTKRDLPMRLLGQDGSPINDPSSILDDLSVPESRDLDSTDFTEDNSINSLRDISNINKNKRAKINKTNIVNKRHAWHQLTYRETRQY